MRKRLILILTIIILLAGIGVGAWFVYQHFNKDEAKKPAVIPKSTAKTEKVHVDTFGNKIVVLINESTFGPKSVTIKANSAVEWNNMEATPHQVVTDDGATITAAISPVLEQGKSFSFTFKKPGTYAYHDNLHPEITGTVKVE